MKATKILDLLRENKIDELRHEAEIELGAEKIGSRSAAKARFEIAKMAKKEFEKDRPTLDGAWEQNGHQCVVTHAIFVEFSDVIPGMPTPTRPGARFEPNFDNGRRIDISIDPDELIKLGKLHRAKEGRKALTVIGIETSDGVIYFQEKFVSPVLAALTGKLTFYVSKSWVKIAGDNGFGVILNIRVNAGDPKPIKIYKEV